jgi:competence protein ComEA
MTTFPLGVRGRRALAATLVLFAVAVLAWRHASAAGREGPPLRVAPVVARRASRPAAGSAVIAGLAADAGSAAGRPLVVDVVGAVHRPGLVRLRAGARVADAVAAAGGIGRKADRAGVNLAAPVADGQQVVVPRRAVGSSGAAVTGVGSAAGGGSAAAAAAPGAPVSLSTATAEQLDGLPGVGPVTAQKIVDYREAHGPFTSVDELDAIQGIGPSRLADLRGLVVP